MGKIHSGYLIELLGYMKTLSGPFLVCRTGDEDLRLLGLSRERILKGLPLKISATLPMTKKH